MPQYNKNRKLLIAPTLLDSYAWLKKCPQHLKVKAYDSFSNTLNRIFVPPPATDRGRAFESQVYHDSYKTEERIMELKASGMYKNVVLLVKGGNFQRKAKKVIIINEQRYLLFGRIDVYEDNLITDIKTTANFRGKAKYLAGWQHKFYLLCERKKNFRYLIVEFDDSETGKGSIHSVHTVEYVAEDFDKIECDIKEAIVELIDFVEADEDLCKAYYTIYNKY